MRGWNRGSPLVRSPRAAKNFNSPTSSFRLVVASTSYQAQSWDLVLCLVGFGVTLPQNPAVGDQVEVVRVSNSTNSIIANPNQLVNNQTSLTLARAVTGFFQTVIVQYVGFLTNPSIGNWIVITDTNGDASGGFNVQTALTVANVASLQGGINSGTGAAVTTPTLGAAAVVNSTKDTQIMITITAPGTAFTVTAGPTTGTENTLIPASTVVAGQIITIPKLYANWKIAVTATSATWSAVATV